MRLKKADSSISNYQDMAMIEKSPILNLPKSFSYFQILIKFPNSKDNKD